MNKKLFTSLVCILVLSSFMIVQQAEARNVLNDVIGIFTNTTTSSNKSSKLAADSIGQQGEMVLDGSYYVVNYSSNNFHSIPSIRYFTLDKPCEVKFHVINHVNECVYTYLIDADNNTLSELMNRESTKDMFAVLKPGRYYIKQKTFNNGRGIDYEFKGTAMTINTNTDPQYSRLNRRSAQPIFLNSEMTDYTPNHINYKDEYRYYTFVLTAPYDLDLYMDILSTDGYVDVSILDEDENKICSESLNGHYSTRLHMKKGLLSGRYYIKVRGGNKEGVAYSMMIK